MKEFPTLYNSYTIFLQKKFTLLLVKQHSQERETFMNTKAFALLSFLIPAIVFSAFYPEDPEKFQIKIEKQVKHHVKRKPDIYFLGDDHKIDQSKVYSALINEIKKQDNQVDCLFVELPKKYMQEAIDNFWFRNDYSFIEEASNLVHLIYETESSIVKDTQRKNVLSLAKKLNLRTFAIDKLPSPTSIATLMDMLKEANKNQDHRQYNFALEYETYNYGVKRNRIMAERMHKLFSSKDCKKAIAINGYYHLSGLKKLEQLNVMYIPLQLLANDKYDISFRILMSK